MTPTSTADAKCTNEVILNEWHPLTASAEIPIGVVQQTLLLGEPVSYATTDDGRTAAWRSRDTLPAGARFDPDSITDPLPVLSEYLYLWTSLGPPPAARPRTPCPRPAFRNHNYPHNCL